MTSGLLCLLTLPFVLGQTPGDLEPLIPSTPSSPFSDSVLRSGFNNSFGPSLGSVSQVRMPHSPRAVFIPFFLLFGDLNVISWMASPEYSNRFRAPFVTCWYPGNELKPG